MRQVGKQVGDSAKGTCRPLPPLKGERDANREKTCEEGPGRKSPDRSVFPAPRRPQLRKLGPGPRASEVGVRREPPSAPGLEGSAGRLSIFGPKPRFPGRTAHRPGLTCFREALTACPFATATSESFCREPAPAGPGPTPIGQAARHSRTPGAVETAIATELGTTSPGMLCSQGLPING